MAKVARSVTEDTPLAATDLGAVTCPAMVMAADDDIGTLEHTLEMYRGLPDAQLAVVSGASHLLLHEKPELCARLITDFLTGAQTPPGCPFAPPPHTPPLASAYAPRLIEGVGQGGSPGLSLGLPWSPGSATSADLVGARWRFGVGPEVLPRPDASM